MHESVRSNRARLGAGAALVSSFLFLLGACSGPAASALPTIEGGVPTVPPSGLAGACLDTDTMAIIDQLKATGADVPTILAANKDKLTTSLNGMQSTDAAVVAWRDALVAAINSNDAQAVAAQVALLSNGQVTIPPC